MTLHHSHDFSDSTAASGRRTVLLYKRLTALLLLTAVLFLTFTQMLFIQPVQAAVISDAASSDSSSSAWPVAPDLISGACILMDADTGAILYEKNAYEKGYPASTTKIMTGLLVCENCNLSDTVTFSREAANSVSVGDATLGTKTGEQYTVEQALYGLLLYSANEIAYGLAEHTAGSLSAFVDMMNQKAKDLGATNTHFANASGLYDDDHYTTPYDMAMIARSCFNNPTFLTIDSTTTYTIPATNKTSTARAFNNRNLLLPGMTYGYQYCVGGKTGYTDQSGDTLVSYAEKNGMRLIAVCFQSTPNGRFQDAASLFDWGFNNFQKISVADSQMASLFSASSYYDSALYNKSRLHFTFDATYLTLPSSMSLADVSVSTDPNSSAASQSSDSLSSHVQFSCLGHTVGTATLTASSGTTTSNSDLPYLQESSSSSYHAKWCFVINVWVVLALVLAVLIFLYVRHSRAMTQRRDWLHRRFRRRSRNPYH